MQFAGARAIGKWISARSMHFSIHCNLHSSRNEFFKLFLSFQVYVIDDDFPLNKVCSPNSSLVCFTQLFYFLFNSLSFLSTRSGIPHFPDDFPDTLAGSMLQQWKGVQSSKKYERTPPNKRVSFTALGVSHPFAPDWESLIDPSSSSASSNSAFDYKFNDCLPSCFAEPSSIPKSSFFVLRDFKASGFVDSSFFIFAFSKQIFFVCRCPFLVFRF
jgi:hypothetical protein